MKYKIKHLQQATAMKSFMLIMALTLVSTGCEKRTDSITLVSLDENSKETIMHVPKGPFNKALSPMVKRIGAETIMGLDHLRDDGPWTVDKVEVGLAVSANLNLGVVKAGVTPGLRLIIKKQ